MSGYSAASRDMMPASSSMAASRLTPPRSAPNTVRGKPSPRGVPSTSRRSGTQIFSIAGKAKPSGMTPMISAGSPFTVTTWPSTSRSPPKRSIQIW